ncbi:hypothetical protein LIER_43689 [Lithospermum erythrorhizon]|uniref:Reverse transcriptase Ty1/copia-type domain-containing protein n=1 Tax=Lithospermum erythrorhizon TaxID=34254 RepID=A0AAV3QND4_LITER
MDVNNTFMHGNLYEVIYMQNPPGLELEHAGQSENNHFLFIKAIGGKFTVLLVYVDDILVAENELSKLEAIKQHLHKGFTIKDLGKIKFFLGVKVMQTNQGIYLNKRKYVVDMIRDMGLLRCKPGKTPMVTLLHLRDDQSLLLTDVHLYRRRLLYLGFTKLDIVITRSV